MTPAERAAYERGKKEEREACAKAVEALPRGTWGDESGERCPWPIAARAWQRIFLGNAVDVELDSAGRILIAPELRQAAGLTRDVMMLGMGGHFEIWDEAKYAASEAETIAAGMPEALRDFSF